MKLAIITGGSRGIGAKLLAIYKSEGYMVKEFSRSGQSTDSIVIDLSRPELIQDIIEPLFAEWAVQKLDEVILFNNAGTTMPLGVLPNKRIDEIMANINVNYISAILLLRAFIGAFQEAECQKTVVNISSGLAVGNLFGASLYSGAKAGIEHYVRGLATEQREQTNPIRFLNIDPGSTDTEMQAGVRAQSPNDFPNVDIFIRNKESGALKSPAVVASAIQRIVAAKPENGSRHQVQDYL
ncbi:MAG: SDR family NAD(P)-dependent oxidoreductase [Ardenticatenaceae bacterium]|nr:SDR family NAD(P)-dependent oxidoreductase [Anaerolineales bacterium]MCB9007203.1 SDR family NAD(P)-dependent oxidoreductase [Ardenticatenaceae bacterium]